jgi:hypothetical protein
MKVVLFRGEFGMSLFIATVGRDLRLSPSRAWTDHG